MQKDKRGLRVLHTGDLHLGLNIYGFDRCEEQRDMLRQLADIACDRQVDAIVISGDIYHTGAPSAASTRMLSEALLELSERCKGIAIVATAGNHDSPSRHESHSALWSRIGATMIGTKREDDRLLDMVVEIEGKGYIIAVPYINDRSMPEDYYRRLLALVNERNSAGLPVVLMAHTAVAGADFTGHDNAGELTIGGIDAVSLGSFGSDYDYLALGHIHKPQTLRKPAADGNSDNGSCATSNCVARYSGTPIATSFDERYPHTVTIVDIASHGSKPVVETVEILDKSPLVNIPAGGFADWESVKKEFEAFPDDMNGYIRLNVEVDDFLPVDAFDAARAIAEGKACKFCFINTRRKPREQSNEQSSYSLAEFQALNPLDLARRYVADLGRTFTDEMQQMFLEATRRVNDNNAERE